MLTKMVFKMLLKACIPLVLVVGVSSYGMYTRGGDPVALAGKILGGMVSDMKDSAGNTVDLAKSVAPGSSDTSSSPASRTEVYKWVDADGVTHFGTAPPTNQSASRISINNNVNVVARTPRRSEPEPAAANGGPVSGDEPYIDGLPGGKLPGMAGVNLPAGIESGDIAKVLQGLQQQQPPQ